MGEEFRKALDDALKEISDLNDSGTRSRSKRKAVKKKSRGKSIKHSIKRNKGHKEDPIN